MAYSLGVRFPPPQKYFTLLDPGAYQCDKIGNKQNVAPFLSNSPRDTRTGAKLWTQAIYNHNLPRNIPNCSSMLSKQPRFPYEAFSAEDLEAILCKCGIINPCECATGNEREEEDVVCQGKVKRRIFKGPTPRSILGDEGLSAPSRKDHGFNISSDGVQRRIRDEVKEECPPFYDARVNESTAFYQGCKWSQRTSMRSQKSLEVRPGPADYFFGREPTKEEICAEKVRAFKRKTSRQLRFIEMIQQRDLLEGRPGPATYDPKLPKGTDLNFLGTKAKRFPSSKYEVTPGPADHHVRRDFDPASPPVKCCHAVLPEPACFGMKAERFKTQREDGPGPAAYDVNIKVCNFVNCSTAPFGTSAKRFKEEIIEESDEDETLEQELLDKEILQNGNHRQAEKPCPTPTWEFKSKTIRMKPLLKKNDEPSPADLPQHRIKIDRPITSQYEAPFFTSESRFQYWYNWIPAYGYLVTPGPAKYCLEKPRCPPAFIRGPLFRAERFPKSKYKSPAPNKYKMNNGIETVLATHNKRLKNNIENQHKFKWEPPKPKKSLTIEERENLLLAQSISLLDPGDTFKVPEILPEIPPEIPPEKPPVKPPKETEAKKPKMLRTFLYARPLPKCI